MNSDLLEELLLAIRDEVTRTLKRNHARASMVPDPPPTSEPSVEHQHQNFEIVPSIVVYSPSNITTAIKSVTNEQIDPILPLITNSKENWKQNVETSMKDNSLNKMNDVKESVHDERDDLPATTGKAEVKNNITPVKDDIYSNMNTVTESDKPAVSSPTTVRNVEKINTTSSKDNSRSNIASTTKSEHQEKTDENRKTDSTASLFPLTTVLTPTDSREAPLAQSDADLRLDIAPLIETKQIADLSKDKLKANSVQVSEPNVVEKNMKDITHSDLGLTNKPLEETANPSNKSIKENVLAWHPDDEDLETSQAKAEEIKKLANESLSSISSSSSYEDYYDAGYYNESEEMSLMDKVKSAFSSKSFAAEDDEVDNLLLAQDDAATTALARKKKSGLHITTSEFYTPSRIVPKKVPSESQSTTSKPSKPKRTTSIAPSAKDKDDQKSRESATPTKNRRSVRIGTGDDKESDDEKEEAAKKTESGSKEPEDDEEKPSTSTVDN